MNGRASYGASLVQLARIWIAWFRIKMTMWRLLRLGRAIKRGSTPNGSELGER